VSDRTPGPDDTPAATGTPTDGAGSAPRPLEGVRVLDLSRVLSGPFAGRMLADLGADVVKVEPPEGDMTRTWGREIAGRPGYYFQQNAGKRNVCVDLKSEGGPELVAALADEADVLIENFRPGVLARFGLGWEDLSASNPRLVMLSITGFGQDGPEADRQAYAPVIHAEAGIIGRQATHDGDSPSDLMLSVADTNASLHGLVGLLAALYLRQRTGLGQHVDIAMLDTMLATDDYLHHTLDDFLPEKRLGGYCYDAAGGPILVSAQPPHVWRQISSTFGLADPTPEGADTETKIRCRTEAIEGWIAAHTDRDVLKADFTRANLAWADVRNADTVMSSPTVKHRNMAAEVDDGNGGSRLVVNSPYRYSAATAGVRGPAPRRGEHNLEVLSHWLGLGPGDVERLSASGVLACE